jgi:hypothetical protein
VTGVASAVLAADDTGKAGPLGLLVIVLLGIAVYLLGRSMLHHLKKVPASFDPPAGPGVAAGGGTGGAPGDQPAAGRVGERDTDGVDGPAAPGGEAG